MNLTKMLEFQLKIAEILYKKGSKSAVVIAYYCDYKVHQVHRFLGLLKHNGFVEHKLHPDGVVRWRLNEDGNKAYRRGVMMW